MTDWTAELDQTLRALRDFARATHTYHEALREEGFDDGTATALTAAYIYAVTDNRP